MPLASSDKGTLCQLQTGGLRSGFWGTGKWKKPRREWWLFFLLRCSEVSQNVMPLAQFRF